jgi:hypothetical protein
VRDGARKRRPVLRMVRPPALSEPPAADAPTGAPPTSDEGERCPVCGAGLAPDQEWCVECGAARTRLPPPPDWRIGAAIVLAVIAVVVLVVVIVWP